MTYDNCSRIQIADCIIAWPTVSATLFRQAIPLLLSTRALTIGNCTLDRVCSCIIVRSYGSIPESRWGISDWDFDSQLLVLEEQIRLLFSILGDYRNIFLAFGSVVKSRRLYLRQIYVPMCIRAIPSTMVTRRRAYIHIRIHVRCEFWLNIDNRDFSNGSHCKWWSILLKLWMIMLLDKILNSFYFSFLLGSKLGRNAHILNFFFTYSFIIIINYVSGDIIFINII